MSKREHNNIQSLLPEGYRQLEYIESTGLEKQYIDTGVPAQTSLRLVVTAEHSGNDGQGGMGWASINGYTDGFFFTDTPNYNFISRVTNIWSNARNYGVVSGMFDIDLQSGSQKLNGVEYFSDSFSEYPNPINNIWLFTIHANWWSLHKRYKVYRCKMYLGGVLVRDFIPAFNEMTNKPGLFDIVNGVFYINAGTGEFLYN